MKVTSIVVGLVAAVYAFPASAQDKCGDILQDGAFNTLDWQSRTEYREIVLQRFLSSTYEESKRSRSGIGLQAIGEMIMGSAYTEAQFDQRKKNLAQSYDHLRTSVDDWSHAIRTGNPDIIKAWESCMLNQNGLLARFETQPGNGSAVTLVLRYNGAYNVDKATITYDTVIPEGAKVLSPSQFQNCLAKGAQIASGECRVDMQLSASKPIGMTISTDRGDRTPRLGRRLRWDLSEKSFTETKTGWNTSGGIIYEAGEVKLSSEDITSGYKILPHKITPVGPLLKTGKTDGWCKDLELTPTSTSVIYKYRISRTDNRHTQCDLIITVGIEKSEFVPDE